MNLGRILLLLAGTAAVLSAETGRPTVDSVAITSHSALRAITSRGASRPDRVAVRFEVRYAVVAEPAAEVSLALDDRDEMDFSTIDRVKVPRGEGTVDLRGAVRVFGRDTLNGLVLLRRPGARPDEKPLAVARLTIDLRSLEDSFPVGRRR